MIALLNTPTQNVIRPGLPVSESEPVIEKITHDFLKLLQIYHATPVETLQACSQDGEWAIKDTFAVVSAWVWRCAALLEAAHISNGPLLAEPDVDGLNQEFYNNRQNWTCIDVEVDFCKSHQALLAVLKQLPPERLADKAILETIATQIHQRHAQCYVRSQVRSHSSFQADNT
ncbi:MAG: ClbS/DfsB family four-helix bundle protein [Anaerolineae bacterium]|nr:ClbS/DfsB family four-helix bundle protein [Anaerolineae bacterium]MCB9103855.1 ClbS/DfsB family four-helix bundle protein [Anaerolineales bacterium]